MYQLLNNKAIHKKQWDEVVNHSPQSQLYATSEYLDIIFPEWKGLIWKDETGKYKAVAPIYEKNYFFWKTCIQPPFIQQGGVFTTPEIEQDTYVESLIHFLRKRYSKLVYSLNVFNSTIKLQGPQNLKKNYVLPVESFSMAQLNTNRKRDFKKTVQQDLTFSISVNKQFTEDQFLHYASKLKSIKLKHLKKINRLTKASFASGFEVRDEKDQILSKVLIAEYNNKAYYLLPVNFNALQKGISTRMIIELTNHYLNKIEILDFEGGTVKNMAQFYQGFGAIPQVYKTIS